jgi:hypothetical protein
MDGSLHAARPHPATLALILAAILQVGFSLWAGGLRIEEAIVPDPPTRSQLQAFAFGDDQFLYRSLGLELQNFGDTGGRFTPMGDYDYVKLKLWFERLDELDPKADYVAAIASDYYGISRNQNDIRQIVDFLLAHARRDPATKWRWMARAAYLARHKLGDKRYALEIARELAALPDPSLPVWVRAMPAYVLAEIGEREAASDLLNAILASDPRITPEEARGMRRHIRSWSRP